MLKIDNSLLVEIGLSGLPDAEKNSFLKHVYETLEMRVGIRLADQMSNEQLDEFERYFEAKDDAGAFKWLETNFPNYKDIVQEEFDKLKAEVAQTAPQILAASQAQAAAQPVVQHEAQPTAPAPQPQAQPQPQPELQHYAPPAPQQQYAAPEPVMPQQYAPEPAPAPQQFSEQPAPQQYAQPQYQQPQQPAPQQYQTPYPEQQPPAGPAQ
jgi:hypothetical protein